MGQIFEFLFSNPMTNALLLLYELLGRNYVLAILALTVLIRFTTMPLTFRQQMSMARMSAMQPRIKEIQEKYKSDQQRMMAELNRIGAGPGAQLGGCLPLLIQFPILIGLFNAINRTLTVDPRSLLELGKYIYGFLPGVASLLPVNSQFLLWDLGQPDKFPYIIPILVVGTTYLSNKLMTPASTDPQMQQTNQLMSLTMPVMFGIFMLNSPVGLGIYWLVSNLMGVAQYYITKPRMDRAKAQFAAVAGAPLPDGPAQLPAKSGKPGAPAGPAQLPPRSKVKSKSAMMPPADENKKDGKR